MNRPGLTGFAGAAVVILGGVALSAGADAADINGTLHWQDHSTPRPIAYADIHVCETNQPLNVEQIEDMELDVSASSCFAAITGSDGSFAIEQVPPGHYFVQADFKGGTLKDMVTVEQRQPTELILSID